MPSKALSIHSDISPSMLEGATCRGISHRVVAMQDHEQRAVDDSPGEAGRIVVDRSTMREEIAAGAGWPGNRAARRPLDGNPLVIHDHGERENVVGREKSSSEPCAEPVGGGWNWFHFHKQKGVRNSVPKRLRCFAAGVTIDADALTAARPRVCQRAKGRSPRAGNADFPDYSLWRRPKRLTAT